MNTCKILMAIGGLGAGVDEQCFALGMQMGPDMIAADAGSTDSGPAYLANAMCKTSRQMLKHDLAIMVKGSREANIPVMIGSCGTCGSDAGVEEVADIVTEILHENGWHAKIAKVYSEVQRDLLKEKYAQGKIHALEGAPEISEATFDEFTHAVVLMGAEPFIEAYKEGADIILCGRATDTAIVAALPILKGCNVAAAWHGAKTAECGSQCCDNEAGMGVFLEVDEEGFNLRPLNPEAKCTPYTVAAHLVYENVDPYVLTEPSGRILTKDAVYTQLPDGVTTRVTGTKFEHAAQYTNKLEAAGIVGYQNISLVAAADPDLLADPETWIKGITAYGMKNLKKSGMNTDDFKIHFKAYGYNGLLPGKVPEEFHPREILMLMTVTAKTQALAKQVAKSMQPLLLHFPANWNEQLPSFAFPFSPADCDRGPCYEFKFHHVIDVDDPLELIRFAYTEV